MTQQTEHILKGKTYTYTEPVTRARALKAEGFTCVKKAKVKGFHHALLSKELPQLRVPLIETQPLLVKEILEVRMRHPKEETPNERCF